MRFVGILLLAAGSALSIALQFFEGKNAGPLPPFCWNPFPFPLIYSSKGWPHGAIDGNFAFYSIR